jgi:DNA-binding XRE family transcriptional regulator
MTNFTRHRKARGSKARVTDKIGAVEKKLTELQQEMSRLDPAKDGAAIEQVRGAAYKMRTMVSAITDDRSALHRKFCENVRARREKLGLTQQQIALKMGITVPTFYQIESGRHAPGIDAIGRVADALECSAADLLK